VSPARTVAIACFPSFGDDSGEWAIVGIDVIRATTTAVTAVAAGRRCFPVPSIEAAVPLAGRLSNPLLVGELGGNKPYGFELQNSPAEMDRRVALDRPVVLLSTTGTRMLCEAAARHRTYVACLRNARAQAEYLAARHERVMLVAGETRGEFREEDRLCCGRIAKHLVGAGFEPRDVFVEEIIKHWGDAADDAFLGCHSVDYLEATGQMHDVAFILEHMDDLDSVFEMRSGEVVPSEAG
jgi:2-phosphosulfolactate phosphatase